MIDLYGMASPNVQKVILLLEELELPYLFKRISVVNGEQFSAAFRRLNPNSKVPVIVDTEGPAGRPYTVFESGAILIYLAEKAGRFLPQDTKARYDVLQWLMIQLTGLGPMSGQHVHFRRYAPDGNDYAASRYRTELLRLWDVLETRLAQTRYLGGDDYSIADIATFPWTLNRSFFEMPPEQFPSLIRWSDAIAARPAAARLAGRLEELLALDIASTQSATADQLDRYFGRGRHVRN